MDNTPRKASDILLELVAKVDLLLSTQNAQDLNIKVLSNKLNELMRQLEKQAQKITVEAVTTAPTLPVSPLQQMPVLDPERYVPITANDKLPLDNSPKGFRRTARPETFEGDNAYLPSPIAPKFPTQLPKPPPGRSATDVVVPPSPEKMPGEPSPPQKTKRGAPPQHAIPVMQRIVDKSGKSIFLADVEIVDHDTAQSVFKTRTNGTGKWMASLGAGNYRVTIRKGASNSREKMEAVQDIQVSGNESPLELQTMIIR